MRQNLEVNHGSEGIAKKQVYSTLLGMDYFVANDDKDKKLINFDNRFFIRQLIVLMLLKVAYWVNKKCPAIEEFNIVSYNKETVTDILKIADFLKESWEQNSTTESNTNSSNTSQGKNEATLHSLLEILEVVSYDLKGIEEEEEEKEGNKEKEHRDDLHKFDIVSNINDLFKQSMFKPDMQLKILFQSLYEEFKIQKGYKFNRSWAICNTCGLIGKRIEEIEYGRDYTGNIDKTEDRIEKSKTEQEYPNYIRALWILKLHSMLPAAVAYDCDQYNVALCVLAVNYILKEKKTYMEENPDGTMVRMPSLVLDEEDSYSVYDSSSEDSNANLH